MDDQLRRAHVRAVLERLRGWLDTHRAEGIVLTRPAGVAWATGGMNPAIDRASPTDLVWVAVGHDRQALITTVIEADRVAHDSAPADHGFDLAAVPWYGEAQFVEAAARYLDRPAAALAADGHPSFGSDLGDDLIRLRLAHTPAARQALRALGADTARALETAVKAWAPGVTDRAIQARMAASLEEEGAEMVVALISGDGRVERFRHPIAAGLAVHRLLMAVVVARRDGLHVAATRLACAGRVPPELARRLARVRRVEAAVLAASRPGATYGEATEALARGYAAIGAPRAWQQHYQGGPIGYASREFELAPPDRESRWWGCPISLGHAVAWNPSLSGGAKVEDTFLVESGGLECITPAGDWPTEAAPGSVGPVRASILELT